MRNVLRGLAAVALLATPLSAQTVDEILCRAWNEAVLE